MGRVSAVGGVVLAAFARVVSALALLLAAGGVGAAAAPSRAAYFYHYMSAAHVDSLAAAGFDTALIHWIPDTLGVRGARELQAFRARGLATAVDIVPEWSLQQLSRLAARPADRRYTWGGGVIERDTPCPLDSAYWRSALLDRVSEWLATDSTIRRVALDLELWKGRRHHWDAGPCRCRYCVAEYRGKRMAPRDPRRLTGLHGWEEASLERRLIPLLREFARRHPGVELGVLDLDYEAFPHRALARALVQAGVPTADWCEKSYGTGGRDLAAVRRRLLALGLGSAPLHGGIWLGRFSPAELPAAVRGVRASADGWFAFTTYSLWQDPAKLQGAYTLAGPVARYWDSLREANVP